MSKRGRDNGSDDDFQPEEKIPKLEGINAELLELAPDSEEGSVPSEPCLSPDEHIVGDDSEDSSLDVSELEALLELDSEEESDFEDRPRSFRSCRTVLSDSGSDQPNEQETVDSDGESSSPEGAGESEPEPEPEPEPDSGFPGSSLADSGSGQPNEQETVDADGEGVSPLRVPKKKEEGAGESEPEPEPEPEPDPSLNRHVKKPTASDLKINSKTHPQKKSRENQPERCTPRPHYSHSDEDSEDEGKPKREFSKEFEGQVRQRRPATKKPPTQKR